MGNPINQGATASSNPSEAVPYTAPHTDSNANGVVFGYRTPGTPGSSGGAR